MIDLLSYGIDYGVHKGVHTVEIPSCVFVRKCLETKAGWTVQKGPLPPD